MRTYILATYFFESGMYKYDISEGTFDSKVQTFFWQLKKIARKLNANMSVMAQNSYLTMLYLFTPQSCSEERRHDGCQ